MSNLTVDNLTNQDVQLTKAWVNFNGTGVVSIRASFNVSSITDNAVGTYTVNFINAMVDADYAWNVGANRNQCPQAYMWSSSGLPTTTQFTFNTASNSLALSDTDYAVCTIQGN